MQKNSGGGEDLIRGGDIFYLGGCTPPCTPPENPPMNRVRVAGQTAAYILTLLS